MQLTNYNDANEAAEFLSKRLSFSVKTAVFTGTGLAELIPAGGSLETIAYNEIPHFPVSTVQSHYGRVIATLLDNQPLLIFQGRFHLYEGYSPHQVTFPIRVLQALGVETLILTNASGGLNFNFEAGDIMILSDHINLTGDNPLIGANDSRWGSRFPEMTEAYSENLQHLALKAGRNIAVGLHQGVYVGLKGPSLETPAEMRFLRIIGADAVGFSTVMETIAAVHAGMRVLGLSVITNMCLPEALHPTKVDDIIAVAQATAPYLRTLIIQVLKGIAD